MTNSHQMTNKQAAELFSELLNSERPLYEVYPDPDRGAVVTSGRFVESLSQSRARFTVEPTEKTPDEAMAISAIREAHKRVRKAVADDGDLIAVLDKLATLRAAAERQRARYDAVKRLKEHRRNELREAGNSPDEIEAVAYRNGHDLMSGLVRTLALLAACDFVETWYLETGELPTAEDAQEAVRGLTVDDQKATFKEVVHVLQSVPKGATNFISDICEPAGQRLNNRGGKAVLERLRQTVPALKAAYPELHLPDGFRLKDWMQQRTIIAAEQALERWDSPDCENPKV